MNSNKKKIGLIVEFRCACIYTCGNVNLNSTECPFLNCLRIYTSLFTERVIKVKLINIWQYIRTDILPYKCKSFLNYSELYISCTC